MKLYFKAGFTTLIFAALFAGLFWKWNQSTISVEGEKMAGQIDQLETQGLPGFSAKDLADKSFELKDFKGSVVVVNFWASWCGPCVEEFPSMIRMIEKMKGKVQLIAVSQDSSKDEIETFLKAFPGSHNPNIHIVWDGSHDIGRKYNADRLPESYVSGPDLKLVKKIVGAIPWDTKEALEYLGSLAK